MAPELFDGDPASPRSDIYAVGVMFYYLLDGPPAVRLGPDRPTDRAAPPGAGPRHPEVRPGASPTMSLEIIAPMPGQGPAGALRRRPRSWPSSSKRRSTSCGTPRDWSARPSRGSIASSRGAATSSAILFPLPNDRLQEVYLEVGQGRHGERLLSVFSVCCPAEPEHYEFALKLNAELTYGSLSIRKVNGQPMFVMTRTFPRGHVHPEDVRAALIDDRASERLGSSSVDPRRRLLRSRTAGAMPPVTDIRTASMILSQRRLGRPGDRADGRRGGPGAMGRPGRPGTPNFRPRTRPTSPARIADGPPGSWSWSSWPWASPSAPESRSDSEQRANPLFVGIWLGVFGLIFVLLMLAMSDWIAPPTLRQPPARADHPRADRDPPRTGPAQEGSRRRREWARRGTAPRPVPLGPRHVIGLFLEGRDGPPMGTMPAGQPCFTGNHVESSAGMDHHPSFDCRD